MPIRAAAAMASSTVLIVTSSGREAISASARRREREASATAIATPQRSDGASVPASSTALRFKRKSLATSGISARMASSALMVIFSANTGSDSQSTIHFADLPPQARIGNGQAHGGLL